MIRDPNSLSLRQMNRLRVIEVLYRHPGSSRTDLARWTGLSRATVSTLVNILNPELIVVGGDLAPVGAVLLDPIKAAIERHGVAPAAAAVRVTAGTLGDRAEVMGAAGLILAQSPRALGGRVDR